MATASAGGRYPAPTMSARGCIRAPAPRGSTRSAEDAGVPCVRCELPGVARARNAGFRATHAPIVAFTDDDCLVAPDWTGAVAGAFHAADRDVAFVTGRVLPDRRIGEVLSVLVDE